MWECILKYLGENESFTARKVFEIMVYLEQEGEE